MKINIDTKPKKIIAAIFAVAIFAGFGLVGIEKANADGKCTYQILDPSGQIETTLGGPYNVKDKAACDKYCQNNPEVNINCTFTTTADELNKATSTLYKNANTLPNNTPEICKNFSFGDLKSWINCPLLYFLRFLGFILTIAATIFSWVVNPVSINAVFNNEILYRLWSLARDSLNIAFILMLLFYAFCTIFQVEKYNYRKHLLTLIIMALLVNFSFPISRFIIDFFNSMMFFQIDLSKTNVPSGNLFANLAGDVKLNAILMPESVSTDTSYLIAAIIFTFILAITLLMIAVLLVIRTVVLAVIIVVSPVGFVGSIIPTFEKTAQEWWTTLFKYAFFGPSMLWMLAVAVEMMKIVNVQNLEKFASSQTTENPGFIAAASFYAIPIVILWIGIGTAQKMGIIGANAVIGSGTKFMGWAGKTLTGYRTAKWSAQKLVGKEGKLEQAMARNKYLKWFSPTVIQKAWEDRAKEVKERSFRPAVGDFRDKLYKFFDNTKTNYGQLERERLNAARKKEIGEISQHSGQLLNMGIGLIGNDSEVSKRDWNSIFRILYTNRDQDELMGYIRNRYKDKILPGGKSFADIGIKEDELGATGWNANQAVRKIMHECGEDDAQIDKLVLDLGEIAGGSVGIGYGGSDVDENGNMIRIDNKWAQSWAAIKKMATVREAQGLARDIHRNNITSETFQDATDLNGNILRDKETGEALQETILAPEFTEMVRQGTLGILKEHVSRHNQSFYAQVGDSRTIRAMEKRIEELRTKGAEGFNSKTGKVEENMKIDEQQYKSAKEWLDTFKYYVEHGKKPGGDKDKKQDQEAKLKELYG